MQGATEWPGWLNWDHIFELKRRWGISAAALVRRAYDPGALTEASYRRANIRLRQFGQEEPAELPPEVPTLLNRSIELLGDDYPLESLALEQGLSAADVQALVRGDVPGSPSDPTALSSEAP